MEIENALSKSSVILFSCDKDGIINLQEGGGLAVHGLKPGQHLGLSVFTEYQEKPVFLDALKEALKGKPVQAVYKWGSEYCETQLTPTIDGGVIGVCTTQTERILREREIFMESVNLAKMERRKDFLAYITHEIRSPLSGIVSLLDIIVDDVDIKNYDNLIIIQKTGNQILHLVNDLLDISKIDKGKMSIENIAFDISETIQSIKLFYEKIAIDKGIKILCTVDYALINKQAYGDPHRIRQIVSNFVSNAIKFTNNGGEITISVQLRGTGIVQFFVKDSGIGISEDDQKLLFSDYFQSNEQNHMGSGLGLSISKKLIEIMNGKIGCTSTLNHGSIFWFELLLPIKDIPIEAVTFGYHIQELNHALSSKIMIADDNVAISLFIMKMLHKLGYTDITICKNGIEALKYINECKFDIIFLDNYLQMMSGDKILTIIKQSNNKSFVVSVSGESNELDNEYDYDYIMEKQINLNDITKCMLPFT